MNTLKYSNRGGIPCLKSTSAVVVDTTLTVTFPIYSNFPRNYSGHMTLNIGQPFTATGVTAINLVIQGTTVALTIPNNAPATDDQVTGPGIYEVFVDNTTNTVQLI